MLKEFEQWYRRNEKNPEKHFLSVVLTGWFGLHKFMEGKILSGVAYLMTCGCFGVFYLYDLFLLYRGTYFQRKVTYVDGASDIERKTQKIYYPAPRDKEKVLKYFLFGFVVLALATHLIYKPIGNFFIQLLVTSILRIVTGGSVWLIGV